jgi:hypothetical protein
MLFFSVFPVFLRPSATTFALAASFTTLVSLFSRSPVSAPTSAFVFVALLSINVTSPLRDITLFFCCGGQLAAKRTQTHPFVAFVSICVFLFTAVGENRVLPRYVGIPFLVA